MLSGPVFLDHPVYATVLLLDWTTVAETVLFEGGTQIWCIRTEDSLNLGVKPYTVEIYV